jgi:hypothetical protein
LIDPSALRAAKALAVEPLKPMAQSRYGVTQTEEVQMRPLVVAIPGFIQLAVPLPPLKPMAQSRRGGVVIEPSILMAAKACQVE